MWFLAPRYYQLMWSRKTDVIGSCDLYYRAATAMGDLIGLNYQAADIIWKYAGITLNPEQFKGLMLFAKTVVTERNKKKG